MRNRWRLALVTALLTAACSESGRRPAGLGTSTGGTRAGWGPADGGEDPGERGASATGGDSADAGRPSGGAGQPSGGAADGSGSGTDGVAGARDGGTPIDVEPLPEPTCAGTGELRQAVKLAISTVDADHFGSITPDERVIAWTVVSGSKVTLYYSGREREGDDFSAASTLELTDAADDSVSLSPDGLRVVYVNGDRKGFTQLVRAAVDEPFSTADNRDFVPIAESAEEFAEDEHVGDPVLGPDDWTFFYSRYGAGRSATLLRTLRFSSFAPWPAGTEVALSPSLGAVDDERKRPTAVSLDRQTLFLWNSAAATQTVAMLSHETMKYEVAFELEDARGAAPNAACSRVYYDHDGDLWTAEMR